jgi:hypothetical protein
MFIEYERGLDCFYTNRNLNTGNIAQLPIIYHNGHMDFLADNKLVHVKNGKLYDHGTLLRFNSEE